MSDEVVQPEDFSYERIEVGHETYITVRGACEVLGIDRSTVWEIATRKWPYLRLSRQYLIEYEAVLEYAQRRGYQGNAPPPLTDSRPFNLPRTEILSTKPGVITTAAHLARSGLVTPTRMSHLVRRGLPAQLVGVDTIIYEDEWWDFIRREWERPRAYRPRNLPKPEGVILGPIVPSPKLGVPTSEWVRGKFVGWADRYAELMEKGKPPQLPPPRTPQAADRLGLPRPKRVHKPRPPNPHGPRREVDRLQVGHGALVSAYGAAIILGLSRMRAIGLAREAWNSTRLGQLWLIPLSDVIAYSHRARPRGSKRSTRQGKAGGPRGCPQQPVEVIETRPGVLTTTESLTRRLGLHRMAVHEIIKKGLPATRVSKSLLVYEDDFERFTGIDLPKPD